MKVLITTSAVLPFGLTVTTTGLLAIPAVTSLPLMPRDLGDCGDCGMELSSMSGKPSIVFCEYCEFS